jgi:NADH-quinone oxidoreductase subunit N
VELNIAEPTINLGVLFPHLLLAGLFILTFILELFRPENESTSAKLWIPVGSLLGVAWCFASGAPTASSTCHAMLLDDVLSRGVCAVVFTCLGFASLVPSRSILKSGYLNEYFGLLTAAALGLTLFVSSNNLMLSFLALELFSLSLYLLCIFLPERRSGQEASFKYFILSSLASAIMLYGMAFVYGACGTTWLNEIAGRTQIDSFVMLVGSMLVAVGFAFKISAVPFHIWAPDVYQGAPTPVTAFMSVATKAAAVASAYRFYAIVLGTQSTSAMLKQEWQIIFWSLAAVSMVLGNLMAISQTDLKRMLAYSGIAQGGYLMATMSIGGMAGIKCLLFYLFCYTFMNFGAFAALCGLEDDGCELTLEGLKGSATTHPLYAGGLAVCLFALTGLPLTGGFVGKVLILSSLLHSSNKVMANYLAIALIISSFLGACYYLRAVATCYAHRQEVHYPSRRLSSEHISVAGLVLGLCCIGCIFTGVFGEVLIGWIDRF